MIFQLEVICPYISGFFTWVSESAGIFVLISGVVALSWLGFERKRRGSFFTRKSDEDKESLLSKSMRIILRIISYLGFIVGILDIWAGAIGLIRNIPPSFASLWFVQAISSLFSRDRSGHEGHTNPSSHPLLHYGRNQHSKQVVHDPYEHRDHCWYDYYYRRWTHKFVSGRPAHL